MYAVGTASTASARRRCLADGPGVTSPQLVLRDPRAFPCARWASMRAAHHARRSCHGRDVVAVAELHPPATTVHRRGHLLRRCRDVLCARLIGRTTRAGRGCAVDQAPTMSSAPGGPYSPRGASYVTRMSGRGGERVRLHGRRRAGVAERRRVGRGAPFRGCGPGRARGCTWRGCDRFRGPRASRSLRPT